jgi:methylmalonyl-CoA mutase
MAKHPEINKWEDLATKELRGKPLESLNRMTPEGIPVKPLYTAEDLEGLEHLNSLPGFAPYMRGPKAIHCQRIQRILPPMSGCRSKRPLGGL